MDIAAFDAWRAAYDTMTYADQQAFYDRMEAEHPVQAGYLLGDGPEQVAKFLTKAVHNLKPVYVLELGGWDGGLAAAMLDRFPDIAIWLNLEICRAAVQKSVIDAGPRYATYIPADFAWRAPLPPCNVLIASHFIEHIRQNELGALLDRLPDSIRYIAFIAPLPEYGPVDWTGYHGSHILEIGWQEVTAMLAWHDFNPFMGYGDFRGFVR